MRNLIEILFDGHLTGKFTMVISAKQSNCKSTSYVITSAIFLFDGYLTEPQRTISAPIAAATSVSTQTTGNTSPSPPSFQSHAQQAEDQAMSDNNNSQYWKANHEQRIRK
jgi:hypothetical protein